MLDDVLSVISKDIAAFSSGRDRETIYADAVSERLQNSLSDYYKSLIHSASYLEQQDSLRVMKAIVKEKQA